MGAARKQFASTRLKYYVKQTVSASGPTTPVFQFLAILQILRRVLPISAAGCFSRLEASANRIHAPQRPFRIASDHATSLSTALVLPTNATRRLQVLVNLIRAVSGIQQQECADMLHLTVSTALGPTGLLAHCLVTVVRVREHARSSKKLPTAVSLVTTVAYQRLQLATSNLATARPSPIQLFALELAARGKATSARIRASSHRALKSPLRMPARSLL